MLMIVLWTSVCSAEEMEIGQNEKGKYYLLNAKTINEIDDIIKARVKFVCDDKDNGYFINTWIIKRTKHEYIWWTAESYDKNGKFKGITDLRMPLTNCNSEIQKILEYIDKEGK